jgi:hypothetical protein
VLEDLAHVVTAVPAVDGRLRGGEVWLDGWPYDAGRPGAEQPTLARGKLEWSAGVGNLGSFVLRDPDKEVDGRA